MTPVHHAINYVEITVTDMDAAQHFYGTAFGWRFTDYAPAYAGIQAPEGDCEVGGLSLGQNVEPGGPLVLLYSDDLDATVAAVNDAGGTIAEGRTHSRADGASPSSTRAGTGSAYGAQPRQYAVQEEPQRGGSGQLDLVERVESHYGKHRGPPDLRCVPTSCRLGE
jgi:uncharacterized protein